MENAPSLTIPQLGYQVLHQAVQKWLQGLNPRRIPLFLPLVAAYLAGVLWTRGAATCKAMAAGGVFSHDALNRLLIGPSLRGLLQMAALTMVDRTKGYLVIDDIVLDKEGPKIAGIAWLYSSSLGQKVRALNVVVLGWTNGKVFIPLTFRFWKPPRTKIKGKPSKDAFDGSPFQTKLELAVEMLRWAKQRNFTPTAVLFDAYYLAKPVFKVLKKAKWQWVSRIKGNRNLKLGRSKFQPKQWAELARSGQAPNLGRSMKATLGGWGSVRIIAVKRRSEQEPRFLIGSNPEWGRGTIERLYSYRWDIEVAFRNSRQLVGLNDCQCRIFGAQENHVALVLLSYLFVLDQGKPSDTVGGTLNRLMHQSIVVREVPDIHTVRPIKPERRKRKQHAHPIIVSADSA